MSAAIVAALRAQLFAAYSEIEALRSALGARRKPDAAGVQSYRVAGAGGPTCEHSDEWLAHRHICAVCRNAHARANYPARRALIRARQADGERRRRKPCPYCGRPRSRRARMCRACHHMIGRGA